MADQEQECVPLLRVHVRVSLVFSSLYCCRRYHSSSLDVDRVPAKPSARAADHNTWLTSQPRVVFHLRHFSVFLSLFPDERHLALSATLVRVRLLELDLLSAEIPSGGGTQRPLASAVSALLFI